MESSALVVSLVLLTAMCGCTYVMACSCMPEHPQQHWCRSDFVIVARVKREVMQDHATKAYKIKIKKQFKVSEKAAVALESGRLVTSSSDSMCGVNLKLDETYLITGNVGSGQARITLCSYIVPFKETSPKQRKGFKLLYKQGCSCKILQCPWWRECSTHRKKFIHELSKTNELEHDEPNNVCLWETSFVSDHTLPDCQAKHSMCMKMGSGGCGWTGGRNYRDCMKSRRRIRDEKLANEP